jgi:hypothetical protein
LHPSQVLRDPEISVAVFAARHGEEPGDRCVCELIGGNKNLIDEIFYLRVC